MKLSDWAKNNNIKYLKAYRMFKDGSLPVQAYQNDKGMIYVGNFAPSDNESEKIMNNPDVISEFFKKSFEFARNNSSIEDFAYYILKNFKLSPVNSKEEKVNTAQSYYKEYLNPYSNREKPSVNMHSFTEEETVEGKVLEEFETIQHSPSKEEVHFLSHLNSFKKEKPKPSMFIPNSLEEIGLNEDDVSSSLESVKGSKIASEIENSLTEHFTKEEVLSIFKDYYKNNKSFPKIKEPTGFIKYGSDEQPKKKTRGRPKKGSK